MGLILANGFLPLLGSPGVAVRGAHLAAVCPNPTPSGVLTRPHPPPSETGVLHFLLLEFVIGFQLADRLSPNATKSTAT